MAEGHAESVLETKHIGRAERATRQFRAARGLTAVAVVIGLPWLAVFAMNLGAPSGRVVFGLVWGLRFFLVVVVARSVADVFPRLGGWFPRERSQWLLVPVVVVTQLLLAREVVRSLGFGEVGLRWLEMDGIAGTVIPREWELITGIVLLIAVVPILEEVFYRGHVLGELRRASGPSVALVLQSLLFGMAHFGRGSAGMANAALLGAVLGLCRLSGTGLVPLIVAHSIFNLVVMVPLLVVMPDAWSMARSTRCQQLERLRSEPVTQALPIILDTLAGDDDQAIVCATLVLKHRYADRALSGIRDALRGDARSMVFGALFAWSELDLPELLPDVRRIAAGAVDRGLQVSALAVLVERGDVAWVRSLADDSPDPRTRRMAAEALGEPFDDGLEPSAK